jgi:glycosyltransferase involved in cell wall biosynthesis
MDWIQRSLQSVLDQSFAEGFEVLVVDNGPGHMVSQALGQLDLYKRVRFVRSSPAGVARARNTALRCAQGDIVAFLDDDAIADPLWLHELVLPYRRDARVGCAGGRIVPAFVKEAPKWLREAYGVLAHEFAALDYGDSSMVLGAGMPLYGPNLSVRKDVALRLGGFNESMATPWYGFEMGEDVEFVKRCQDAGYHAVWVPSAVVRHVVTEEKMTRAFVVRRMAARAVSAATGKYGEKRMRQGCVLSAFLRVMVHYSIAQGLWLVGRGGRAIVHDRVWSWWWGVVVGKLVRHTGRDRLAAGG